MTHVQPGEGYDQENAYPGADGVLISAYDDVVLLREIVVDGGVRTNVTTVPPGTIATVLAFMTGPEITAHLECYVGEDGFTFGFEDARFFKLHMTNEEKYPR